MDTNSIKSIIGGYREIIANIALFKALNDDKTKCELIKFQEQKLIIESWLLLLNDMELFIIDNHLVAKVPWSMMTTLFQDRWGPIQARDERTLKRIQAQALKKISENVTKHKLDRVIEKIFK